MTKLVFSPAIVGVVLAVSCFSAAPGKAAFISFVSGHGADTGNCSSPASPCRTFQYALGQTYTGGEIKALDPANYSPVTINRSITITGVEGAGVFRANAGNAITVNVGANDKVTISGLTLDGFNKTATNGIALTTGGFLTINNCAARHFGSAGVLLNPGGIAHVSISDVTISENGNWGILVQPFGAANIGVSISHMTATDNQNYGLYLDDFGTGIVAMIVDSFIKGSGGAAIASSIHGTNNFRLRRSVITGNNTGVNVGTGRGVSYGDNSIDGNTGDDIVVTAGVWAMSPMK